MKRERRAFAGADEKPVQRITLSEEHIGLRIAAAVLCVLIAVGAIGYAVYHLVATESGWTIIEPEVTAEKNGCQEFVLQYELGRSGAAAGPQQRALAKAYTAANGEAYRLFSTDRFDELHNVGYLNDHPNEVVTVDKALYDAFALLEEHGSRYIYLAPVYERYDALFFCTEDHEAEDFDPMVNEGVRAFIREVLPYTKEEISLELLGEGKVRLNVSDAYLKYAEEQELGKFLDFFWLRNAFIADYTAEALEAEGYTNGVLSSYDGFTRHLGDVSIPLSFNILDNEDGANYAAAVMAHENGVNLVYLRDHPMGDLDVLHYYTWADGQIRGPYVDTEDGVSKSAVSDLVAYGKDKSCAQLALAAHDVFAADRLEPERISEAAKEGVDLIFAHDRVVYHTDPDVELTNAYKDDEVSYRIEAIN